MKLGLACFVFAAIMTGIVAWFMYATTPETSFGSAPPASAPSEPALPTFSTK